MEIYKDRDETEQCGDVNSERVRQIAGSKMMAKWPHTAAGNLFVNDVCRL